MTPEVNIQELDYQVTGLIQSGAQVALAYGTIQFSDWTLELRVERWSGEGTRYTFKDLNNPTDTWRTTDYSLARAQEQHLGLQ